MSKIIIYCDESDSKGKFFSNFYGGALIASADKDNISNALNEEKFRLNLHNEVKRSKVTGNYLEKYMALMKMFFIL